MADGRVLAANKDGAYVLRLEGDVRLTLCASIDDFVDQMLDDPDFSSVWVDLCDAEGIDSTTLGQLAKLALAVNKRYDFRPAIYCCDSGINRLLRSMGLDRLFALHEKTCCATGCAQMIPMVPRERGRGSRESSGSSPRPDGRLGGQPGRASLTWWPRWKEAESPPGFASIGRTLPTQIRRSGA